MSIYRYLEYSKFLDDELRGRKARVKNFTLGQFADSVGMQRSYLSQVLSGQVHVTEDHLFMITQVLELNETEAQYLRLLVSWKKSGLAARRKALREQIKKMQAQQLTTKNTIESGALSHETLDTYYETPVHALVHIALTLTKYRNRPDLIVSELGVGIETLQNSLKKLVQIGVLKSAEKPQVQKRNLHIEPGSPTYQNWSSRTSALIHSRRLLTSDNSGYNFSAFVSMSDQHREEIKDLFLDFLKKAQKVTENSPPEDLYTINFNLFRWR